MNRRTYGSSFEPWIDEPLQPQPSPLPWHPRESSPRSQTTGCHQDIEPTLGLIPEMDRLTVITVVMVALAVVVVLAGM